MKGIWLLSWRHLLHHRVKSGILVLCIALAAFLPVTVQVLIRQYQQDLSARADATPMVAGAKGNRYDLTLAALYFRQSELDTIPFTELRALAESGLGTAIPVHARFTARGHPVVGTSPEYFRLRRLHAAAGTLPLRLGDVAVGSRVATELKLQPGSALFSDPTDLYDLSRPPALKMRVSGVLPETGGPDDQAVFVDIKTCWILEGIAHGHDDPKDVHPSMILGETENAVTVSPALRSYQEVTPDNLASFHLHVEESELPLSAIVVVPKDDKSGTLLKARLNTSRVFQMVVPTKVIDDLMRFVFRIKALFDVFAIVLALTTALLLGLQIWLSMRLRAAEMATLNRIGCSPHAVAGLYLSEVGMIVGLGLVVAAAGVGAALALLPDMVRSL